jgi:hypothetical protein
MCNLTFQGSLVIDNITKEERAWLATNDLLLRAPREVR